MIVLVIVGVLACPAFELRILFEQELEGFTNDVGWVRINEVCVPVQVAPDFFLQADLEGCGLRLLRRCFQKCQAFLLLSSHTFHYSLHYKPLVLPPAHGQNTVTLPDLVFFSA